eukprot:TRINITY_DN31172_c0_g1_i1.p1 TRINITY_DN31172_c0_g1~~TRINITY_DN31172_c0_g1_i1.p1  ORF type:complete len:419 (-),score=111.10 TRINITY_DN31172_c0_g1_i1:102-1313(-)
MCGSGFILLCLLVITKGEGANDNVLTEEEEGIVEEDLSDYIVEGDVLYKTLWKPKDCAGPIDDGDDVTMVTLYYGQNEDGKEVEMEHALTNKMGKGPTLRSKGDGLFGMCLGEHRRLVIPQHVMRNKYKQILPGILDSVNTYLEVQVTKINQMSWHKFESGLLMAMLEPVESEYCSRTVVAGDTLAVEYEGTLENGKVFDSSANRGTPFGPFVHGKRQIIEGYTETLEGRCLGERWRMTVPPHLAYGDNGVGDDIPGGATLTFDVRLVQLNGNIWSEEMRNKKALAWDEIYKPEGCEEIAGFDDELYIHYDATREDGAKFGSLVDNNPPYGPFSLTSKGTFVPALDYALPGMCLGERRMVVVPPRMGWVGGHHDSIMVEVMLVKLNGKESEKFAPDGPPKSEF